MVKLIQAAVRQGGNGDPEMNAALRLAVEKAGAVNMPKDNIERAIKKALGDGSGIHYEALIYEGYAVGGVAILVEALTDNRNRTTPEVRKIFEKNGGNMGEMGCVAWMFKRAGMIQFEAKGRDEEKLMELAMEVGADDVELSDDGMAIFKTEVEQFAHVIDGLKKEGFEPKGDLVSLPETPVPVDSVEIAEKILKLMELIEEHDDVQSVTSNMDLTDEVRAALDA